MTEKERSKLGMSPQKALEVFGEHSDSKLKKRRVGKGFSQQDLANASGVSKRMIQAYEHGTRDINKAILETICGLCLALDCKIEDILDNEELIEKFKRVK